jgi:hypothetical protein
MKVRSCFLLSAKTLTWPESSGVWTSPAARWPPKSPKPLHPLSHAPHQASGSSWPHGARLGLSCQHLIFCSSDCMMTSPLPVPHPLLGAQFIPSQFKVVGEEAHPDLHSISTKYPAHGVTRQEMLPSQSSSHATNVMLQPIGVQSCHQVPMAPTGAEPDDQGME